MRNERNGGTRVAILATDGVERVELTEPRKALEGAGFTAELVSPAKGALQSYDHEEKSERIPVDRDLNEASPSEYDALLLPGGVRNPDILRMNEKAVDFVRAFVDAGKPVAAICHGPWMLVEANVVDGLNVTSWPSVRTDLENAGASWTDEPVVEDEWLITSRKPDDIPQFNERIIALFRQGKAAGQAETAGRR